MIEKEYIEREAAQKVLADDYAYNATKSFDTVPIADVQEVVRCKDCIFGKYDDDLNMILCKRIYNLSDGEYVYNDLNDFCSYGERIVQNRNMTKNRMMKIPELKIKPCLSCGVKNR